MAGSGVEIGRNVLILYNDSTPHSVTSLGYSSKKNQASDWIVPGYYYPLRRFLPRCFCVLFELRVMSYQLPPCTGNPSLHVLDM